MANSGELGFMLVAMGLGGCALASLILGGIMYLISGLWLAALGGAALPPFALWLWWNR